MTIRRTIQVAVFAVLALALSGCEDDKPIPMVLTDRGIVRDASKEAYVPPFQHPDPMADTQSTGADATGQEIAKHDPLLQGISSPLDDSPATGDSADDDTQPVVDLADPLINPDRPKNWYWLRGRISEGEVSVTVNGRDLGFFSVRMDREITDNLRRGYNTIDFTPHPVLQSQPVKVHLEVVYSQQEPGAAPVLIYDTTKLQSMRDIEHPSHAPQIGGSAFAADPDESSALNSVPDFGTHVTSMKLYAF